MAPIVIAKLCVRINMLGLEIADEREIPSTAEWHVRIAAVA